eukprot:6209448-Pleurochrysis_carterae.AAC.1
MTDPSANELKHMTDGDVVYLEAARSKTDFAGIEYSPIPSVLPYRCKQITNAAATLVRLPVSRRGTQNNAALRRQRWRAVHARGARQVATHGAGQPLRRANGGGVVVALAAHWPRLRSSRGEVPRRKHPTYLLMGNYKQPASLRAPGHRRERGLD